MKIICLAVLTLLLFSCTSNNSRSETASLEQPAGDTIQKATVKNKTIQFLWREDIYDEEYKDTFNRMVINEQFCATITDPERAALGYVATFIGNECNWDGESKDDRSNLKCKILSALNLGYQCSEQHLGFLRKWFRNDPKALENLSDNACPTMPDGATIQDTFDEIVLTKQGDTLIVWFKASGINMREQESWSWEEINYFRLENNSLKLIKTDESKVTHEHFEMGE